MLINDIINFDGISDYLVRITYGGYDPLEEDKMGFDVNVACVADSKLLLSGSKELLENTFGKKIIRDIQDISDFGQLQTYINNHELNKDTEIIVVDYEDDIHVPSNIMIGNDLFVFVIPNI